jgi:hypothetical protein
LREKSEIIMSYETDFFGWTQEQTGLMKSGNYTALDYAHLLEEIEEMARCDKNSLQSYIKILLLHLLKWRFQPEKQTQSWTDSIDYCRDNINDLLCDSPSYRRFITEMMAVGYHRAVRKAARETLLPKNSFPAECQWTFEQIMDEDFWP